MTNREMLRIAMKQSAEDIGCRQDDFLLLYNVTVPFYCSAWSNIRSVRNAVKSGFIPAWVEMTAKPAHIVDDMNKTNGEKENV